MSSIWDRRARLYDYCESSRLRRGPSKSGLFAEMAGKVLFLAVGTGADIPHFPPGLDITGIDISREMLRRAAPRARAYSGRLRLMLADALDLPFPAEAFDTAVTSCTMCSVPDPARALGELHRVLRPGAGLLLFEHVRSRQPILGLVLDAMTLWTRRRGTDMNRPTLAYVRGAGFEVTRVECVYLDIILAIRAKRRGTRLSG